jgi:uncharacterized membrane protein
MNKKMPAQGWSAWGRKKIINGTIVTLAGLMLPLATLADGVCRVNDRDVPCDQIYQAAKPFIGIGLGIFAFFAIIGMLLTIFWIWMLVHAATKNIENKVLWIVLLIIFGFLAAIVYYFAVKRPFDKNQPIITPPPTSPGPTPPGPKIA